MKTAALALILGLATATASFAATISGTFWDADAPFRNIQEAIDYAENPANAPAAMFHSTVLDYPNARRTVRSGRTTLGSFLGDTDGATIVGDADRRLTYSVFRFTGVLDLDAGTYRMTVGSDDGFRLIFEDSGLSRVVAERARPRGFRGTNEDVTVGGNTSFTLYYYENRGRTGVRFSIDGDVVDQSALAPIPLPASISMLGTAVLGLGFVAMRRRSKGRT